MTGINCPAPRPANGTVRLAHGGGGRLTQELIERIFYPALGNPYLDQKHDAAELPVLGGRVAMTTDAFVVRPLFFPGGDIGSLAVDGTVNDLVMAGARPLYLSAAFILEEGLPLEVLERVTKSLGAAATSAGVAVVTGDTKVVGRGQADGLYITTTGLGVIPDGRQSTPARVRPGDALLVSGDIGRHGLAVMACREGIEIGGDIASDVAPLADLVETLWAASVDVRCLRDLTRGGLATALHEVAEAAGVGLDVDESAVPVNEAVGGACEILGLNPWHVACEGRFAVWVSPGDADRALAALRAHPQGREARLIGRTTGAKGVTATGPYGVRRPVDRPSGELLPRIC